MTIRKSTIGKYAKKLLALVMAFSFVSSSLCLETVSASASESSSAEVPQANIISPASSDTDGQDKMAVYKDGIKYETTISANSDWDETVVEGSTDPTVRAKSVEEYNGTVSPIPVNEDLYTLTVSTGINAGTSIEYFAIRYTDANDTPQTKYIFPTAETIKMNDAYLDKLEGDVPGKVWVSTTIKGTRKFVEGNLDDPINVYYDYSEVTVDPDRSVIDSYLSQFIDYEITDNYADGMVKRYGSDFKNAINEKHEHLRQMSYTINETTAPDALFKAWSIDEILFKTDTPIKNVNAIEVFMAGGKWTVQGMAVSKVTSFGGYGEYGFYSGKYFTSLGKQLICEMTSRSSGAQTFSADGDTLLNIGGAASNYFSLRNVTGETSSDVAMNDLYSFRLDFTDLPDGGIESFIRTDGSQNVGFDQCTVAEHLALEVSYKDTYGWTRTVTMPVLLSALGQYKKQDNFVRTMGMAQRGDTIAFTGCLPEYDSLISTKLYVGKAARDILKTEGGIVPTGSFRDRDRLIKKLDSDPVRVAGISVYKGTCYLSNTANGTEIVTATDPKTGEKKESREVSQSFTYAYDFYESAPLLYYTTESNLGIRINPGASDTFRLVSYRDKAPLIGSEYQGNVLIRLRTDTVSGSAPTGTARIRLTYQDTSGSEMSSPYYDIAEEVKNYIGCWPSLSDPEANFAYTYGTMPGGVVEFPVQLANVSAVTNVEINLGPESDEWQIAGISVAVVNNIGKRRIYRDILDAGTDKSGYRIVRSMDKTVIPPFPISMQLLVQPGDSYSFSTGEGTIITSREPDFEAVRYSMTYAQSQENYGFAKARKTYDIRVSVAKDPEANSINGDSGSKNHFYFQLRFQRGTSGYVLANQQLSSDAFRAGHDEDFAISVNRDYGDLTEVRIIPKDISEDSDVFDKLNIENIAVTERTSGGTANQWVFENVGWISIDYYDQSQNNAVKVRAGRSALDIAKSFKPAYKQKVMNLLCEISTLPWNKEYDNVQASVSCDLDYIDTNGEPRSESFDVISRMAYYMNKTPISYNWNEDGSNAAQFPNMGTISDPKWMLRPNTYDRFILPPLANVKTITGMTFKATSRNNRPGQWVIGDVKISTIKSDSGTVTLNANGEYYRSMSTNPLCSMVKRTGRDSETITLLAGTPQKLSFKMSENTISWSESSAWATAVSKFPDSTNDTINVFLFPTSYSRNIDDVDVSVAAQYTISNSRIMQVSQNNMNTYGSGTENAMFYFTGLSAFDMKNLCSLSIYCGNSGISFDHALVQQVREGVVVMTYTFNLGGSSATLGIKADPEPFTANYEQKMQKLMLSFGTRTKETVLFGQSDNNLSPNDIAVCLKYRSSLDRSNTDYFSPYVYLTEAGIQKISPGLMAEVTFDVPYVEEITGYRIISFGNVRAEVESAMAVDYSISEGEGEGSQQVTVMDNVYSFYERITLANTIKQSKAVKGMEGEGTVSPLELTFTTAEAEEGSESGINAPVEAMFAYTNSMKQTVNYTIPDLRVFIQAKEIQNEEGETVSDGKQFMTGKDALVKLFLPDCKELISITLKPSEGTWKLDSISGSYKLGAEPINRKVNAEFTTEGNTISVKNVTLSTNVNVDGRYKGRIDDHEMNIKVDGGKTVEGTVVVNNGSEGFGIRVDLMGDKATDITDEVVELKEKDKKFIVTIPNNNSSMLMNYSITIWPIENPGLKDVINVAVPVPDSTSDSSSQADSSSAADTDSTAPESSSESGGLSYVTDSSSESGSSAAPDSSSEPQTADWGLQ